MSLTPRDVIKRAMRLFGALASGDDPTASEAADYLLALNTLKRAMFGTFIGPRLSASATSTGGQMENGGLYMVVTTGGAVAVQMPGNPRSGARVGVADVTNGFGPRPCSVVPNGRLLEGGTTPIALNVSGTQRQWWFRGDTGNWTREADFVTLDDVIEFPDPLIAYLPYMLAVVISPEIAGAAPADIAAAAQEGREAFARSYAVRGGAQIDPPIGFAQPQQPAQGQ